MKTLILAACTLVAGTLWAKSTVAKPAAPASQNVAVTFVSPENFTDFRDSFVATDSGVEQLMADFRELFERVAPRYLAEGQRLEIAVRDVDLAGDFEPWRGPNFEDIRIIKDLYPPRAEFDYRLLSADGSVVRQGRADLRNLAYLFSVSSIGQSDSLRYEREMITDWFRQEFRVAKK